MTPRKTASKATSFPGSLFSASIVVVFSTTMEEEKRDPGNEVASKGD